MQQLGSGKRAAAKEADFIESRRPMQSHPSSLSRIRNAPRFVSAMDREQRRGKEPLTSVASMNLWYKPKITVLGGCIFVLAGGDPDATPRSPPRSPLRGSRPIRSDRARTGRWRRRPANRRSDQTNWHSSHKRNTRRRRQSTAWSRLLRPSSTSPNAAAVGSGRSYKGRSCRI